MRRVVKPQALFGIGVGLLVAASGCTKQQTTNPSPLAPKNSAAASFGQVAEKSWFAKKSQNAPTTLPDSMTKVQKAPEGPKRPPKVETCLLAGQSFLDAAEKTEESAVRAQRLNQARKAFEQALGLDPSNTRAALGLARVCDQEGDYLSAEAGYREVLRIYANDGQLAAAQVAQVWYDLGMCQARQKSWDEAVEALQKAAKLSPGNTTYSSHLGWALARSGQYEAALKHFRRTVGPARAHYNLALMMNHLGYEDHCRQYLHAALKIDPNLAEAHSLLEAVEPAPAPRMAQQQPRREVEAETEIVPVDFRASPAPAKPAKPAPAALPVKAKTTSMKPVVRPQPAEPLELPASGLEEQPLPDAAEPPAEKPEAEEDHSAESILESNDASREQDAQDHDGETE